MDKISRIKSNIDSIISLSHSELAIFCDAFIVKTLKKNDLFLRKDQICDYIGLIISGALTWNITMDDGNEITIDFGFEGDWATITDSRLNNIPSLISIKAIENSELLVIKQQDLENLYIKMPKLERMSRILMEQKFIRLYQFTINLQIHTAKQRYESLLKRHPEIFEKIPLYHIANYLGIAPQSLSRIRSEIYKK
jgi:CRP-like cAMP-binding protein